MRVTLTGATGLIGSKLVKQLQGRGDEVTVLSRSPERARETLGDVETHEWEPTGGPAPAAALLGRDVVVNLAGENLAQRWTHDVKRRIVESRELGTRNLVAGIEAAGREGAGPRVLVSSSAVGIYGDQGDTPLDERSTPASDFLADLCVRWEREADAAAALGLRVVKVRTGIVLDADGGALSKMLLPFKLGVGGPVAGGEQYMPWIHTDDVVGIYLAAIDGETWEGPVNATAPAPVTNATFSKALGRALHRPAFAPIPGFAIQLLYGEMSELVTKGQRVLPERARELGYAYRHPDLDEALRDAIA